MCGKYLLTTCIHGMNEWNLSATYFDILVYKMIVLVSNVFLS